MKVKWILRIFRVVLLLAAGGFAYWYFTQPRTDEKYATKAATLKSVKELADLATLDFHEEMAVKGAVAGKWIVSRMTVEGSVIYDMDSVRLQTVGDTLMLVMPKERFDFYESTAPASYEVIDTWDDSRPMFGRKLTTAEENAIKRKATEGLERRLRRRGYVERARDNARAVLLPMLGRFAPDSITHTAIIFR